MAKRSHLRVSPRLTETASTRGKAHVRYCGEKTFAESHNAASAARSAIARRSRRATSLSGADARAQRTVTTPTSTTAIHVERLATRVAAGPSMLNDP